MPLSVESDRGALRSPWTPSKEVRGSMEMKELSERSDGLSSAVL